ncbi:MAG TPA: cytochrome c [Vicinamibacterales bacterium]|nr:cytochrome c [Vicinamibacterales bacterium]
MVKHVIRTAFTAGAIVVTVAVSNAVTIAGQQPSAASVFTAEQAAAGKPEFLKTCAACHMPDLGGNNEVPQLAGVSFRTAWSERTTKDLLDYMSANMPPNGSSLTAETYVSIAAFILESNGAVAGEKKLTASTAVAIASLIPARSAAKN